MLASRKYLQSRQYAHRLLPNFTVQLTDSRLVTGSNPPLGSMNSKWALLVLSYRPTRELGIRRNQGRLFMLASSVKQIAQEGLARLAPVLVVAVEALMPPGEFAVRPVIGLTLCVLDEFVLLSPIQPHTATFGAVVDLDSLTLRHHQIHFFTYWTFHN